VSGHCRLGGRFSYVREYSPVYVAVVTHDSTKLSVYSAKGKYGDIGLGPCGWRWVGVACVIRRTPLLSSEMCQAGRDYPKRRPALSVVLQLLKKQRLTAQCTSKCVTYACCVTLSPTNVSTPPARTRSRNSRRPKPIELLRLVVTAFPPTPLSTRCRTGVTVTWGGGSMREQHAEYRAFESSLRSNLAFPHPRRRWRSRHSTFVAGAHSSAVDSLVLV
jgi:hypothetical protein